MSRQNEVPSNNLDDKAMAEITEALFLIYTHTQKRIKSITFQNNVGVLNFGSNNRIQINLPVISTLKFVNIEVDEEESQKKNNTLEITTEEKENDADNQEEGQDEEEEEEEQEDQVEEEEQESEEEEEEEDEEINNEEEIKKTNKKLKRIERLQNLGRTVNSYIGMMENTSDSIITEDQFVDNSLNIMFSKQVPLSLTETIFHWKRKMDQTTAVKTIIDVYSFIHIVALLKIYEDIEKNKEDIQKNEKYKPKKKKKALNGYSNIWLMK